MTRVDEQTTRCLQEEVREILLSFCNKSIYSAAALTVSAYEDEGYEDCVIAVGTTGTNEHDLIDEKSVFDLASLTKPCVTLPLILSLVDKGVIDWDEPLHSLLEIPLKQEFGKVTLARLLSHSSGFTAHNDYWKWLIEKAEKERERYLLKEILDEFPEYRPGSKQVYSDVGYILLGFIIEKKTDQSLDRYWHSQVAEPLGMGATLFYPFSQKKKHHRAWVSTGRCRWSGRPLTGLVHDDNCRALGGVAGHAGLFGSSEGLQSLCKHYLNLYHGRPSPLPISPQTFKKACLQVGDSDWSCGFTLPSTEGSSSGVRFSRHSIGHLGFTGVSFWIDLEKQRVVSLLTNRVLMGDDQEGIRKVRPVVHDAVVACLENKKNPPAEPGDR